MAILPRVTLKSFFEEGDFPTEDQFASLIDSMYVRGEDDDLVGLSLHKTTVPYKAGQGVIKDNKVYYALVNTQGVFDPVKWQSASSSVEINNDPFSTSWSGNITEIASKDSLYNMAIALLPRDGSREMNADFSFSGNYKVKWSASKYLSATGSTLDLDTEDTLNLGANADVINIGNGSAVVNIYSATAYTVGESEIQDALIRLNKGGGVGTGINSGFEIEEAGVVTGYVKVHPTDRTKLVVKVPGISHVVTMDMNGKTAAQTLAFLSDIPSNATIRALISATTPIAYNNTTGVITWTGTTSDVAEGSNQYFTETRVRASVLTGLNTTPGTVVAADSILAAIGKLQGNSAQNATNIATKATLGGDLPTGTWRVGTNNAQAAVIRSNNVDRITVDINGNIIVAGTTTNVDLPRVRLRNTTGAYLEALSMAVVSGQLDIGIGVTEINFTKPITNYKGTNSRLNESGSNGTVQAIEEIVPLQIYNFTVQGLLSNLANWNSSNAYTGTSLASFLLSQGQFHVDANFYYFMVDTVTPIRIPRHRVRRRLFNSTTTVGNVAATGETDLHSYTILANTVNQNRDAIECVFNGVFSATSSAALRVYVGGTLVFSRLAVGTAGFAFTVRVRVVRLSSTTCHVIAEYVSGDTSLYTNNVFAHTATFAFGSDTIVKITGQDSSDNRVLVHDSYVEFNPSV
jgi:hypothetical protein